MADKLSEQEFLALKAKCEPLLQEALKAELTDTTIKADPKSDLWELPTVDSKTVCKLSPKFEELTGRKLKVKWVKKGGYDSIPEAVADLMSNFAKDHVATAEAVSIAAE